MSDEKRTIFGYVQPGAQQGRRGQGPQGPQGQSPQPHATPPAQPQQVTQPPVTQPPLAQPPLQPQNAVQPPAPVYAQTPSAQPPMQPPPNFHPQPPMAQRPWAPQPQQPIQRPQVKPVSVAFYLTIILGGIVIGGALFGWGASDRKVAELLMFAWIPVVVGFVFFYILIYKAWAAIYDGQTRTSPGKAVGFLFIPVFNIYWLFVGIGGWADDYNRFLQRHRIPGQPASSGLFMFHCIASLVLGIAVPFTMAIICLQMCRGINTVAGGGVPQAVARY